MVKKEKLSLEGMLEQALVKDEDKPYEVPENWEWTRLGEIGEVITGNTPSKNNANYYGNSLPFFKPTDLNQGFFISEAGDYLSQEGIKKARVVPEGSTLVTCIGATIGKCGYTRVDGSTNQQINAIVPYSNVNNKCVYFLLCTPFMQDNIISNSSSTTLPILNKSRFENLCIPLPPLYEQQRIAVLIESIFEKLDRAKELVQNALDSFENRKSAIFYKTFTGELTAKWRKENGVDFEKDWVEKTLGKLCEINPPKIKIKDLRDDLEVSFVPMQAVSDVLGIIQAPQARRLEEVKKGYTNFIKGDVIFAKITPCMENGKSAIVEKLVNDIGFGSTEFHVLRCSEELFNRYLYHLVRWQVFRDEAKQVMTGAVGQQRVPKTFLEEYTLNTPPLSEQKEIVRILDSLFEKEQRAKELCDLIENIDHMKKSILARAFRGELGTNNPEEESTIKLLKEILKERLENEGNKIAKNTTGKRMIDYTDITKETAISEVVDVMTGKNLYEILCDNNKKLSPIDLYKMASLDIEEFYADLKKFIDADKIVEIRRPHGEIYLEAKK